eukprot:scaffold49661_cov22-Tisochrysis_lutea.AAC.1
MRVRVGREREREERAAPREEEKEIARARDGVLEDLSIPYCATIPWRVRGAARRARGRNGRSREDTLRDERGKRARRGRREPQERGRSRDSTYISARVPAFVMASRRARG